MTRFPDATILGYPRIGPRRELKRAVESYWAGKSSQTDLTTTAAELRAATRDRLAELGLGKDDSSIPESFSFYDQVLDATVATGAIPARFEHLRESDGSLGLDAYFTIARGQGDLAAAEMTKWFDSNYHYLVPEIGPETTFSLSNTALVDQVREAAAAGYKTRPVVVGPVTLLALAKASDAAGEGFEPLSRLNDVLPVYAELLAALAAAGAEWVQLDEPALVSESLPYSSTQLANAAAWAYRELGSASERPAIFVAAPYAALPVAALEHLAAAPIEAIGIDLVRGTLPETVDGLDKKVLVAGVIDGHNIWRGDLGAAFDKVEAAAGLGAVQTAVSSSTSLLHVPHTTADEPNLDARLVSWLAFADEKVGQIVTLARGAADGRAAIADELQAARDALADRAGAPGVHDADVRARTAALAASDFSRGDYAERVAAQNEALSLPPLPLTTIGSFPQTGEIRQARAKFNRAEIDEAEYEGFLRKEIERVIRLQEELGLDVLVHGEAERNDMVQYFAELLDGFAVTENGWVQSYGSRATRPSILWGDVSRPKPMTTEWSLYAQSLTDKPVKGMLTGPVTILAWSFVRDDQPLRETANQVALALRDEVHDLETAGIGVIQVDEPALRELLPLKEADQADYLDWSVGSFRLSTAGAAPATQIHTHLCYSEFGQIIDAILGLDADVTSIEAARSRMDVVKNIEESGFDHGIGPGVYDIHSPRVPSVDEIEGLLKIAVSDVPVAQLWVNPDCGLKTRGYDETNASLANMVEATHRIRETL